MRTSSTIRGPRDFCIVLRACPVGCCAVHGVADIGEVESADATFPVKDFIEKPLRERVPSNLAITVWYVLTPEIFELLETPEKGVGGELQLTDAIRKLY